MPPFHELKIPSPCGTAAFVGLRLLSLPLQAGILYYDLGAHFVHRVKGDPIPISRMILNPSPARDLPITRMVLLAMATGSSLKQILWAGCLDHECMPGGRAVGAGIIETAADALNMLIFTNNALSPSVADSHDHFSPTIAVGSILFLVGMAVEICAEGQQRLFKKDPKNEGKVVTSGLWKRVRHPNYAGYTLWRAGFAVAAGGWKWGVATAAYHLVDFACRASKELEKYMDEKYGAQWMHYVEETPHKMIPGIL